MAKRILVVPDVHGRPFWKEPVSRYLDHADRIVFLGDYLDPYPVESDVSADIVGNLMEIIELKRKHTEKVVLLKGNHDEHYSSLTFKELAGGTRMDNLRWANLHQLFNDYNDLFKIAHLEEVDGIPYLFTHAGITLYWLNKVNSNLWHLNDNDISLSDQHIVERINELDADAKGQEMLAVIGRQRTWYGGEKTGSVLWADLEEHLEQTKTNAYDLDRVFQVFGHTRLIKSSSMVSTDHFAMIDCQECFMIAEDNAEKIVALKDFDSNLSL